MVRILALLCIVTANIASAQQSGNETTSPVPATAPTKSLSQELDDAINAAKLGPKATVAISVYDLTSKKHVFQRHSSKKMSLASGAKIITIASAFHYLGGGHAFVTTISSNEEPKSGKLKEAIVKSRGDPTLTVQDVERFARQLRLRGVKRIGTLCLDDHYFDDKQWPPHYKEQPKEFSYFRAPISATSLSGNAVTAWLAPSPGLGDAIVHMEPDNRFVKVLSEVATVDKGRSRVKVESKMVKGKWQIKVTGQLLKDASPIRIRRLVPKPKKFFLSALRSTFRTQGIRVGRLSSKRCRVEKTDIELARVAKKNIRELAGYVGKNSSNYHAEMLLKVIAAETNGTPATFEAGVEAVNKFLLDKVGLTAGSFRYGNGSGLFDSSAFTPDQMVKVLAVAADDFAVGPDVMAALAVAGSDGTLRSRLRKTPAAGFVRAKTGTLANVSTLTGYVGPTPSRLYAFSILVGGLKDRWRSRHRARVLQDDLVQIMFRHLSANK